MSHPGPVFGVRVRCARYADRPGAYAIIAAGDLFASIPGTGRLHLPGGGGEPGETLEAALLREIVEELGWSTRVLETLGHATQFLHAAGEGHFAIRATYFRVEAGAHSATPSGHTAVWLPAAAAAALLARESDAWAISRAVARRPGRADGG